MTKVFGYKTYAFVDKDPIIDKLRTLKQKTGIKDSAVEKAGGPKAGTINNWFKGDTRRPQHTSVAAYLGALGHKFEIVQVSEKPLVDKRWVAPNPKPKKKTAKKAAKKAKKK